MKTNKLFNAPKIEQEGKMKNWEVINLHKTLSKMKPVPGIKLNYAIGRTILNLKPLVKSFEQDKLIPVLPEYKKYEDALKAMYEGFAKDENGKVKTKVSRSPEGEPIEELDVDINNPDVIKARATLSEVHKEAIEDRKEQAKLYNEFLMEDCIEEIKLHKVAKSEVPDSELITKDVWVIIDPLLSETGDVSSVKS
jgi:hypothetical protein